MSFRGRVQQRARTGRDHECALRARWPAWETVESPLAVTARCTCSARGASRLPHLVAPGGAGASDASRRADALSPPPVACEHRFGASSAEISLRCPRSSRWSSKQGRLRSTRPAWRDLFRRPPPFPCAPPSAPQRRRGSKAPSPPAPRYRARGGHEAGRAPAAQQIATHVRPMLSEISKLISR